MTAYPNLPFETLMEMVDQLPIEQQQILLQRLQGHIQPNGLNAKDKMRLLRAAQIAVDVIEEPSPRREDWYGEDGR